VRRGRRCGVCASLCGASSGGLGGGVLGFRRPRSSKRDATCVAERPARGCAISLHLSCNTGTRRAAFCRLGARCFFLLTTAYCRRHARPLLLYAICFLRHSNSVWRALLSCIACAILGGPQGRLGASPSPVPVTNLRWPASSAICMGTCLSSYSLLRTAALCHFINTQLPVGKVPHAAPFLSSLILSQPSIICMQLAFCTACLCACLCCLLLATCLPPAFFSDFTAMRCVDVTFSQHVSVFFSILERTANAGRLAGHGAGCAAVCLPARLPANSLRTHADG